MLWDSNKASEGTHQATIPWFVWHGLYGRAMVAKLHGEGTRQKFYGKDRADEGTHQTMLLH